MNVRSRYASWATVSAATLAAAGCVSYRPVQPLDDDERAELAAVTPR